MRVLHGRVVRRCARAGRACPAGRGQGDEQEDHGDDLEDRSDGEGAADTEEEDQGAGGRGGEGPGSGGHRGACGLHAALEAGLAQDLPEGPLARPGGCGPEQLNGQRPGESDLPTESGSGEQEGDLGQRADREPDDDRRSDADQGSDARGEECPGQAARAADTHDHAERRGGYVQVGEEVVRPVGVHDRQAETERGQGRDHRADRGLPDHVPQALPDVPREAAAALGRRGDRLGVRMRHTSSAERR